MQTPPPPSLQQASEAQQARHAAEQAILGLFKSVEAGEGGGEDDESTLHSLRIAAILALLSTAIVFTSFRHPKNRRRSLLLNEPAHEEIAERVLGDAQSVFNGLAASELTDAQKAVVWATWAYSRTAEEIADAVDSGKIPHEFSGQGLGVKKVWISRSDGKVRPLHAKLHGKTISSTSDFWRWPHTGQRLRWPGDREAPPEATIGCRCVCLLSWASQESVSDHIKKIVDYAKNS